MCPGEGHPGVRIVVFIQAAQSLKQGFDHDIGRNIPGNLGIQRGRFFGQMVPDGGIGIFGRVIPRAAREGKEQTGAQTKTEKSFHKKPPFHGSILCCHGQKERHGRLAVV